MLYCIELLSNALLFVCFAITCRYYVEDHGNQLVRTFTGNLTKMLSATGFRAGNLGGAAHPSPSHRRDGKAATDRDGLREPGLSGTGVLPAGFDWTANKLMQTFSGPVRRRFGGKGWAQSSERSSSDGGSDQPAAGSPRIAISRMGGARSSSVGKRDGVSAQRAVERIDEGEPAEEALE